MTVEVLARGPLAELDPAIRRHLLQRAGDPLDRMKDVLPIREEVATRGDEALLELTERYDGVRPPDLVVPSETLEASLEAIPGELRRDLVEMAERVRDFHRAQVPEAVEVEVAPGARAGRRVLPLDRVGCYVPGGRAAYPSTVLMTVLPAKVAGVPDVTVATPPGPDGEPPDLVLAACQVAGADRVIAVGGAQAIFALARGTASVPRVDKIVGPGNAYVTAAKALVAGEVATDAPAGPSEVLVLADATADPRLAALELAAQAEHDPDAASLLVTTNPALPDAVASELDTLLEDAPREGIIREALAARGALLTAADEDEMVAFADAYAPEHVAILVEDHRALLERLRSYGSACLGGPTAVAFGDYGAGPNHVLPTGGLARGRGGLGTADFVRLPTHLELTPEAARDLAPSVARAAEAEGLPAHAASARARLNRPEEGGGT